MPPHAEVRAVPLDELVGAPRTGDPRIRLRPAIRDGMTYVPRSRRTTRDPGGNSVVTVGPPMVNM